MDFDDTPEEAAWRARVRAFLEEHRDDLGRRSGPRTSDDRVARERQALLYDGGLVGVTWPLATPDWIWATVKGPWDAPPISTWKVWAPGSGGGAAAAWGCCWGCCIWLAIWLAMAMPIPMPIMSPMAPPPPGLLAAASMASA